MALIYLASASSVIWEIVTMLVLDRGSGGAA